MRAFSSYFCVNLNPKYLPFRRRGGSCLFTKKTTAKFSLNNKTWIYIRNKLDTESKPIFCLQKEISKKLKNQKTYLHYNLYLYSLFLISFCTKTDFKKNPTNGEYTVDRKTLLQFYAPFRAILECVNEFFAFETGF